MLRRPHPSSSALFCREVDVRLLGPAEAPLALIRGRHRFRLLAKSPRAFDLSAWLRTWMAAAPKRGEHQGGGRRRSAEFLMK
jgi:primosomal protein N'